MIHACMSNYSCIVGWVRSSIIPLLRAQCACFHSKSIVCGRIMTKINRLCVSNDIVARFIERPCTLHGKWLIYLSLRQPFSPSPSMAVMFVISNDIVCSQDEHACWNNTSLRQKTLHLSCVCIKRQKHKHTNAYWMDNRKHEKATGLTIFHLLLKFIEICRCIICIGKYVSDGVVAALFQAEYFLSENRISNSTFIHSLLRIVWNVPLDFHLSVQISQWNPIIGVSRWKSSFQMYLLRMECKWFFCSSRQCFNSYECPSLRERNRLNG